MVDRDQLSANGIKFAKSSISIVQLWYDKSLEGFNAFELERTYYDQFIKPNLLAAYGATGMAISATAFSFNSNRQTTIGTAGPAKNSSTNSNNSAPNQPQKKVENKQTTAPNKPDKSDKPVSGNNGGSSSGNKDGSKLDKPVSGDNKGVNFENAITNVQAKQIETLRNGGEVKVKTYEDARKLLDNMPELRPATGEGKMPNSSGRMRDGFADPNGTYRGDLINKQDPTGPVHPGIHNTNHANNPHYNIKLPNGDKAAIIILGE